jgi:hypothetical protein
MQRLLGYAVAGIGTTLLLCSAHHSNEMQKIEYMTWASRNQAVYDYSDKKIAKETEKRVSDALKPIETLAREQWYTGLKGTLAGSLLIPLGFGITRLRPKQDSPPAV